MDENGIVGSLQCRFFVDSILLEFMT